MTAISIRFNTLLLVVLVLMAGAIITMLATRASGGPLDPPAAPAASGTLPQVEPRMPIPPVGWNGTFPIQITQPGSYFLTRNLTTTGGGATAIEIDADNVTVDLGGFALDGLDWTGIGVRTQTNHLNVSVEHGGITRFASGIDLATVEGGRIAGVRVHYLNILGSSYGIRSARDSVVEDCQVWSAAQGVELNTRSVLRRCLISTMSGDGIAAWSSTAVEDSAIIDTGRLNPDNPGHGVHVIGSNVIVRNNHFMDNVRRDILVTAGPATIIDNAVLCAASVVETSPSIMYAPMGSEPHANIPRVAPGYC